jgi:2-beta-glucuronyltransferase
LVVATSHFFAPNYRRAGMHHIAVALAEKGHHIDFITVGQSLLKQRMKPQARAYAESAQQAAEMEKNPRNIHTHVHREAFHPPSGSPRLNFVTKPLVAMYGRTIDDQFAEAVQRADALLLECGYSLFYFDTLKRLNSTAKYIACYSDRLDLVGFRPEVLLLHDQLMPRFDMVRTNAKRLLDFLPKGTNALYVPQGVDKSKISFDCPSPYKPGTKNIVSVGDMLFDEKAVRQIATVAGMRGARVHVIGAAMDDPPENVTVYGEMAFDRTLPFVVHADVGVAPYAPVAGARYLSQSSLKIQQYLYCGLPILVPSNLDMHGRNIIEYDRRLDGNVESAVSQALETSRMPDLKDKVMGWDQVADAFLDAIGSLKRPHDHTFKI